MRSWTTEPLRVSGAMAVWGLGLLWIFALDDPRLRFWPFSAGMALATLAWLSLISPSLSGRLSARTLRVLIAAGVLARVVFLFCTPAFSDDVFRTIYEGRVVWEMGPGFPFVTAPADAAAVGIPGALLDESWLRINHPEIATIYPPLAQFVFAVAGRLGTLLGAHLFALKLLLVAADLGAWAFLHAALREREGSSEQASLIYGLSPLLILEVAREGHADSVALFGLSVFVWGFARARPRIGYLGLGAAALAKLNGLICAPAALRVERKGWGVLVGCVLLLIIPYAWTGLAEGRGLTEYATRWRAGDGVFSLLVGLSQALLGGDWARPFGVLVTAQQLARAGSALLFAIGCTLVLRAPYPRDRIPERASLLLLLLLLLSPTLHPWYALWILPFIPFAGAFRAPQIALLALVWLSHHSTWLDLSSGWKDLPEVRALIHLPVWALLAHAVYVSYPRRDSRSIKVGFEGRTDARLQGRASRADSGSG